MKKQIFIAMLFVATSLNAALAQMPGVVLSDKPGWHKIAERHVNYTTDRDEIPVIGNDHFKEIKLKVNDAQLNLLSFEVYFDNDSSQVIAVNQTLNPGEETQSMALNNNQAIKKIVLVYKTMSNTVLGREKPENDQERETERERAEVEVWGLK